MKIGEIPENAMVQIRVVRGDMKFECMGVVVATRDDGLYLTPLKHKGHVIDFSAENIQIFVFYVDKNKQAYGWSGCRIRKDIYQRKLCHVLLTKRESVRVNRRSEPRIRTDMPATLRTIADDEEKEIIIRNYSENGLGFISKTAIPESGWSLATVVYEDKVQQLRIPLKATILRGTELPNGLIKYGCTLIQPDEQWVQYVARKLAAAKERRQEAEQQAEEHADTKQ